MNAALLTAFLQASVPLRIAAYRERGGPTPDDFERVQAHVSLLCEDGDALFFRENGKTADVANATADAIATLAFVPGGIQVFGLNFEAK